MLTRHGAPSGFNPRTRMGCDFMREERLKEARVSIHAPAWGATQLLRGAPGMIVVSIHAPAWGATYRSRRWCRTEPVSIHAPAWGATGKVEFLNVVSRFQSTHPHGVRHASNCIIGMDAGFNPRTRMGCDILLPCLANGLLVSIHAPAWGATCILRCRRYTPFVSIHAPAWGATAAFKSQFLVQRFQSTHPHGVRREIRIRVVFSRKFQSTHPHGVRLGSEIYNCITAQFQSTHPHGVRRSTACL